ncbi:Polygalacturonase 1 beta-like protein 1, partial [Linum perenne]
SVLPQGSIDPLLEQPCLLRHPQISIPSLQGLTELASQNSLSSHLHSFCSLAHLFCFFDSDDDSKATSDDANFALYTSDRRFSNYGASRKGGGGVDSFKNYSTGINSASDSFLKYSSRSNRHNEVFANYAVDANAANASFGNYGSGATAGFGKFNNYQDRVNVPGQRFTTYDSASKGHKLSFATYSEDTNAGSQSFISYAKKGIRSPNQFTSYGKGSNIIDSTFTGYGELSQGANDSFTGYGNSNSKSGKVSFTNYGRTFNPGNDSFKGYGKGSKGMTTVGFKSYSSDRTFIDYNKNGVVFSSYSNASTVETHGGRKVEPGRFFRESMLREGNERTPSLGETKRCVGSIEDMIDFAVAVLGSNVVVRTTENVNGSKEEVMIGVVRGINGGQVTKSVSCHQSLYPYLLYYCHSVPKVRVYEADIVDVERRKKINVGVAICHLDTSTWSPSHGAFVALGYGPGQIEVCHWIFENDMTWTIVD